mmetsp:Transcript_22768/g.49904  ORF Transcript_22768/g.49904 Transcript_22768/m.49904 type:complete len:411 (+) Transcript_22768:912-2144(+)
MPTHDDSASDSPIGVAHGRRNERERAAAGAADDEAQRELHALGGALGLVRERRAVHHAQRPDVSVGESEEGHNAEEGGVAVEEHRRIPRLRARRVHVAEQNQRHQRHAGGGGGEDVARRRRGVGPEPSEHAAGEVARVEEDVREGREELVGQPARGGRRHGGHHGGDAGEHAQGDGEVEHERRAVHLGGAEAARGAPVHGEVHGAGRRGSLGGREGEAAAAALRRQQRRGEPAVRLAGRVDGCQHRRHAGVLLRLPLTPLVVELEEGQRVEEEVAGNAQREHRDRRAEVVERTVRHQRKGVAMMRRLRPDGDERRHRHHQPRQRLPRHHRLRVDGREAAHEPEASPVEHGGEPSHERGGRQQDLGHGRPRHVVHLGEDELDGHQPQADEQRRQYLEDAGNSVLELVDHND